MLNLSEGCTNFTLDFWIFANFTHFLVRNRQKMTKIGQKTQKWGFEGSKVGEIGQNTKIQNKV